MLRVFASLLLVSISAMRTEAQLPGRTVTNLGAGWNFAAADVAGAEQPGFDAQGWTTVTVPHDWSIAGPLAKSNATGQGGGYFPNGVGWYRRDVVLSSADVRRRVYLAADGAMANSDIWVNGEHLGSRPNGYVSFYYELTGHVHAGRNVLAVRCDNSRQPASRWYEGAGLYRPVRLVVLNDVHAAPWTTVVTTPSVTAANATVHVATTVVNEGSSPAGKVTVRFAVTGPDGRRIERAAAAGEVAAGGSAVVSADLPVPAPALWSLQSPAMYTATATIKAGSKVVDTDQVPFGIREFHFDPDKGFFLNGKGFKIKGAAMHIDGSAVGIAVPAAVYEHRLRALKALGVNAIRTAHNPPSQEFLDLCDRLGLLVMEEMFDQWTVAKNPYDYHLNFDEWHLRDTRDTVMRDRNHPSIILWSAGNEIHDTPKTELAKGILAGLVKCFHENDPTRPVTQALFRPNVSHDYDNGLADLLDVVGQNYRENEILAAHDSKPARKIIGTENGPGREVWLPMRDHPAYSGQFLWTGVDYLGEAGEAGGWPVFANGSGLIDRTGYPRARGYERESWWSESPNVHLARRVAPGEKLNIDPGYEAAPARFKQVVYTDWTPANPAAHEETVEVYTNCEEAELLLNGASLGRQRLHTDASPLIWKVAYAPGELTAVAYNGGKEAARDALRTAGSAASVTMVAEKGSVGAEFGDVVFVEASVRDANGTMVPESGVQMQFTVSGPGVIVAVDNANNADHDPFQATARKTFQGRAVVMVRATAGSGRIVVTGSVRGLKDGSAAIAAIPAAGSGFTRSF